MSGKYTNPGYRHQRISKSRMMLRQNILSTGQAAHVMWTVVCARSGMWHDGQRLGGAAWRFTVNRGPSKRSSHTMP